MQARNSTPAGVPSGRLNRLDVLTPAQRLAALSEAMSSRHELNRWAARHPDEVPLVNGELPWIALGMADLD